MVSPSVFYDNITIFQASLEVLQQLKKLLQLLLQMVEGHRSWSHPLGVDIWEHSSVFSFLFLALPRFTTGSQILMTNRWFHASFPLRSNTLPLNKMKTSRHSPTGLGRMKPRPGA